MINQIEEAYRENRDSWNEDHRIRVHRADLMAEERR